MLVVLLLFWFLSPFIFKVLTKKKRCTYLRAQIRQYATNSLNCILDQILIYSTKHAYHFYDILTMNYNMEVFIVLFYRTVVTHRGQSTNVYYDPQIFLPWYNMYFFYLCCVNSYPSIFTKIQSDLQICKHIHSLCKHLSLCGSICTCETGFVHLWNASSLLLAMWLWSFSYLVNMDQLGVRALLASLKMADK